VAKQSQIDKAIAAIDLEISVLQAARARLVAAQAKAMPRRPRAVKPKAEERTA
jgi:hypothetical protein